MSCMPFCRVLLCMVHCTTVQCSVLWCTADELMYFGDSILVIVCMTCSSWLASICKQCFYVFYCLVKSASSHCTRCLQLVSLLNSPTHEPFGPSAWRLLRPYLKQILCRHSCVVEMAQSIGFNLSPPQMYHICQPMSTCHLDWSEGKARGQKGCNSWVLVWLNTSTFPSLQPVSFGASCGIRYFWNRFNCRGFKPSSSTIRPKLLVCQGIYCAPTVAHHSLFNKCSQWISLQFCDFHPLRNTNSQLEVCGSCMLVVSYKKLYRQPVQFFITGYNTYASYFLLPCFCFCYFSVNIWWLSAIFNCYCRCNQFFSEKKKKRNQKVWVIYSK